MGDRIRALWVDVDFGVNGNDGDAEKAVDDLNWVGHLCNCYGVLANACAAEVVSTYRPVSKPDRRRMGNLRGTRTKVDCAAKTNIRGTEQRLNRTIFRSPLGNAISSLERTGTPWCLPANWQSIQGSPQAMLPASTTRSVPVIERAFSLSKNATPSATSDTSASLFRGLRRMIVSSFSASIEDVMSVCM